MDLKNQLVKHKILGRGTIVAQDDKYITVAFASKTSNFVYTNPDTFGKFLTLVDEDLHNAVVHEVEETRLADQQRNAAKMVAAVPPIVESEPIQEKSERIPGKPMTFYVFQGETFDIEYRGGFIWAPQHSQNGSKIFHWENMAHVKTGDIVLHGCNGRVVAVSSAVSDCYDCDRPAERAFENAWNNQGRRVDLRYTRFAMPIKTSDFLSDILRYCKAKYSPFDKAGNGNMGYLYELNRELARIFLSAAIRENPELSDIDYIREFMAEKTV